MSGSVEVRECGTARPDAPADATGSAHQDALTGLRGLAVLGIIVFHAGFAWMPGGFLAVSTFFTLSGFLITRVLLDHHDRHGRIDLRWFWARRARRLVPLSVLTAAVVLLAALLASHARIDQLRGDALAAMVGLANWRFIAEGGSYGASFAITSPTEHYWSLAVEEQFYLVYPLLLIAVLALARGSRRALTAVLVGLVAVSCAATWWLVRSGAPVDRLYMGTDVRSAELLVGALLAVWWGHGRHLSPRWSRLIAVGGAFGLAVLVAAWFAGHVEDTVWYRGGLLAYALAGALVVLAAIQPAGPVRRLLGWRPLVALGLVSYAAYLFHWPLFVVAARVWGAGSWALLLVAAPLACVLAAAARHAIEVPLRTRRVPRRVELAAVPAAIAAVALLAGCATLVAPGPVDPLDVATGSLIDNTAVFEQADAAVPGVPAGPAPSAPAAATGTTAPAATAVTAEPGARASGAALRLPAAPLRVLVLGDSTAVALTPVLDQWGQQHGAWRAASYARIGCGIGRGGVHARFTWEEAVPAVCDAWPDEWRRAIETAAPDVIVVSSSFWDATDRKLPGDDEWRAPGDPTYDAYLLAEYRLAADELSASGAAVVWIDNPPVHFGYDTPDPDRYGVNDPSRMQRLNALLAMVASDHPRVQVVPFSSFIAAWPGGPFDPALRPDGIHVEGPAAEQAADFLGPQVLDAYWHGR